MRCPNCKETMQFVSHDKQVLLHCTNCGCSFFDQNVINRITPQTTEQLSKDRQISEISSKQKFCPRDQSPLKPFESEAIPPNVTLLQCEKCKGIFVYPEDLVQFKKAQQVKVDYFKLWNIPFPSIYTIAVLSAIIFISVLSFTTFVYWQGQNISNIQATDLIKNLYITISNRYLFVSFKTQFQYSAKFSYEDKTINTSGEKNFYSQPSNNGFIYQLTTGDINLKDEVYYQIILTDKNGNVAKMELKRLEIK